MFEQNPVIEPLAKYHDRTSFSCGIPELDCYLKERAGQDVRRNTARVFVAAIDKLILGFFTLSATSVLRESLPADIANKLPKYPIPAVLLGRIATDVSFQGKKIGKMLLMNAMERAVLASSTIGMYALVADAKNVKAQFFYKYFGFLSLKDNPMRLFIPLDTIAKLIV